MIGLRRAQGQCAGAADCDGQASAPRTSYARSDPNPTISLAARDPTLVQILE